MSANKKTVAILVSVVLLAVMLFSYTLIAEKTHHHCCGEDCPICMELQVALHTVHSFKFLPILLAMITLCCVIIQGYRFHALKERIQTTLVTQKVLLLN